MPILMQNSKTKLMCGGSKITRMYCQGDVIYSSGNVVTYYVDEDTVYQEEVDEGESCLEPKSFTPEREDDTFAGWSAEPGGAVVDSMIMGDEPISLYAAWKGQPFTLVLDDIGWTKRIDQNNFASGPTMYSGGSFIVVQGKQNQSNTWAIGGFYKLIDTKGFSKVDIKLGGGTANTMSGCVGIGSVNADFRGKPGGSITTIDISTRTNIQELYIYINTGGDTYNIRSILVNSLHFHD